jgi:hypothetical protein
MKLYKTTLQTGADSVRTSWSGAAAAASKDRTEFKKVGQLDPHDKKVLPETEEIDVPTNKTDLLVWLNKNAA